MPMPSAVRAAAVLALPLLGPLALAAPAVAESAAFNQCLNQATTDTAVAQCYPAEAALQEARMQTAYGALYAAQTTPTDRQRLQAMQQAWLAYRDSYCAWAWSLEWGDMPEQLITMTCTMLRNEERADELTQLGAFFGAPLGSSGVGGSSSAGPVTAPVTGSGAFLLPGSDQRALTRADLAGLSPAQLRIARNEIFARHGYIFQSADLQAYFGAQPWYKPVSRQVSLSAIEQANVDLIRAVEQGH